MFKDKYKKAVREPRICLCGCGLEFIPKTSNQVCFDTKHSERYQQQKAREMTKSPNPRMTYVHNGRFVNDI